MKRHVLLLNQTFYPDHAATSQQLTDLGVELVKNGYEVTAISDRRSYDDRARIHTAHEFYAGIRILRVRSSGFGKKSKYLRFCDYLTFNINLLIKLMFLPKHDTIIVLTSPPWIGFFACIYGKIRGSKVIYWVMDINPDEIAALGWTQHGSLLYRIMDWMNCFAYAKSDIVAPLDTYMADRIKEKKTAVKRCEIISPWAHDDICGDISECDNPFRKKNSLDGKFTIMYSGNFSICHPLDTLLETAQQLKENKNIVFLFVGGGVRLAEIQEFKDRHDLDSIQCLPYQDRSELKYSLSAADLHVVVMGAPFVGIIHPCKIYGILSTGRPFVLIGPKQSHVGDIIKKCSNAYRVSHGDCGSLIDIINNVRNLSDREKDEYSIQNKELCHKYYSKDQVSKKMIKICRDLSANIG